MKVNKSTAPYTITLLLLFALFQPVKAQRRIGVFAGGGFTWYYGDMNDRLLAHPSTIDNYWTAGILYRATPRFHFSLSYGAGEVMGADSVAVQDFQRRRDLHFRTDLKQFSLHANYRLLGYRGRETRRVTPYLIGGLTYFWYNPYALVNGDRIELQPLGTEGQYIENSHNPEPYELNRLAMPLGIGVEFKISPSFAARVELVNHFTFFDYFDDVSTVYADSALLAGTPAGALAVAMASNLANGYPRTGFNRGNEKNNDTYMFLGATLLYTPGWGKSGGGGPGPKGPARLKGKKRKSTCPAYH
jgi:hypothetical protein